MVQTVLTEHTHFIVFIWVTFYFLENRIIIWYTSHDYCKRKNTKFWYHDRKPKLSQYRESQAWIYLHRLYWWNSEQGLLALLLGCRFVNTYVCPCMWKLLFAVPSLGRKIPFNFLFFTNPITCAQKQKIILLLCPQKKKLVPRYWFLPYSARTQSHFWETSLDLENTWYSFKRD